MDKLRHQRYEISMKIIEIESKVKSLSKTEIQTLAILKKKEEELNRKIENH